MVSVSWRTIDEQMRAYLPDLNGLGLTNDVASKLATHISADVRFLTLDQKAEIRAASPVPLQDRIEELKAFQGWMELASTIKGDPRVTRAQSLSQNYICFVYLPEACFKILAKVSPSGSAAKTCSKFLSNNPVRAFRNAIAHANWMYRDDFGAIVYWARKGDSPMEPLSRFEVDERTLNYWQKLSRCVSYAAFLNL